MPNKNISWNLLVRYLEGENFPQEQRIVQQWLAADPQHKEFMAYVEKIWESDTEYQEEWDADAAWLRFQMEHETMFNEKEVPDYSNSSAQKSKAAFRQPVKHASKVRSLWLIRWGSAAAVIGIAAILIWLYAPAVQAPRNQVVKSYVSPKGQRTHVRLSDGSNVMLNAGSKLRVLRGFSGKKRRVKLKGEAYFEVAHNPSRSFMVVTKHAKIRDLGTHFDVKAYPDNAQTQVVVVEGKVSLQSKGKAAGPGKEITKFQKGVLDNGSILLSSVKDAALYIGWTKGNFAFNNEALAQVTGSLQRWYDININLGDSTLRNMKFSGRFTTSQSLGEVLDAIALSLNIRYTRQDSTVIFYNKNETIKK